MSCHHGHHKGKSHHGKHDHQVHGENCCCSSENPLLWTKKKKIELLQHKLECLEKQKQEIQEALDELKQV